MKRRIFISSVQKEFQGERKALRDYICGDALLSRFFDVFMFEVLPAGDRRVDETYPEELQSSDIYLGLFGNEYGAVDRDGKSATHKEFLLATRLGKSRLIYAKGRHDAGRHPKMRALLRDAGKEVIRRRFETKPELCAAVYASLVQYLTDSGLITTGPFDATACRGARLADISADKVRWFLSRARSDRDYALPGNARVRDALTHLDLLDHGVPNHAAILLFGAKPQRFLIASEVKCMHFHGTQKLKPIPSYQIYKGTVFDLVDQAVDFVMSKLNRSVGTRVHGPQAPVEYDIPQEAVAEGIVNAVAHRDYRSGASVEIMLFSDRLEIWNPGRLPPSLTIASLSRPHSSHPGNPLIAEPLFLTKYIEKVGTGTVDIFTHCRRAGLKPPQFREEDGSFKVTLWRKRSARMTEPQPVSPTQSPTQSQPESQPGLQPESSTSSVPVQYQSLESRILAFLRKDVLPISAISHHLGQKRVSGQLKIVLKNLLSDSLVEYTLPDKPTSRLQKYRLTTKGMAHLKRSSMV